MTTKRHLPSPPPGASDWLAEVFEWALHEFDEDGHDPVPVYAVMGCLLSQSSLDIARSNAFTRRMIYKGEPRDRAPKKEKP